MLKKEGRGETDWARPQGNKINNNNNNNNIFLIIKQNFIHRFKKIDYLQIQEYEY